MSRAEAAKHHVEDPAAYEHADVRPKGVLLFLGALLLAVLLAMAAVVGLYWLFTNMRARYQPSPVVKANQVPPPPRLESRPGLEMRGLRAEEDAILRTYGWVDRKAGVVRIPIDRAMEMLVQRGLPVRTGQGTVPAAPATGPQSGGPQTGAPQPRKIGGTEGPQR